MRPISSLARAFALLTVSAITARADVSGFGGFAPVNSSGQMQRSNHGGQPQQ